MERPKQDVIFGLLKDAESRFATLHDDMEGDEDYILSSADTWQDRLKSQMPDFPPGFVVKYPGIAFAAVQRVVNLVLAGNVPNVTAGLPEGLHNDPEEARKHKEELEQGINGLLWAIATYSPVVPWREMAVHAGGLGLGVLTYPIDRSQWPPHPYKRRDGKIVIPDTPQARRKVRQWEFKRSRAIPWNVRTVHPTHVYFDADHAVPQWFILEEPVSPASMKREYPHLTLSDTTQLTSKRVQYITDEWYAIYVDREPALTAKDGVDDEGVAPNRLGMTWLEMFWPCMGQADREGNLTYKYKGIVRDARAGFDKFIIDFNIMEAVRMLYGLPDYEIIGPDKEQAEAEFRNVHVGGAQKIVHGERFTLRPTQLPTLPPIVLTDLETARMVLDILIGPEVLSGIFRSEPAEKEENRRNIAMAQFRPFKENLDQGLAAMLTKMLYQIKDELDEEIAYPAQIMGKQVFASLKPERIPYGLKLTVDTTPPGDRERAQNYQRDQQMRADGVITTAEFRSRQGIYNSDEIDDAILEEMLMKHPIIIDANAQFISQVLLTELTETDQAVREEAAGQGLPLPPRPSPNGSRPAGAGMEAPVMPARAPMVGGS